MTHKKTIGSIYKGIRDPNQPPTYFFFKVTKKQYNMRLCTYTCNKPVTFTFNLTPTVTLTFILTPTLPYRYPLPLP